jgi:hypothetical protein
VGFLGGWGDIFFVLTGLIVGNGSMALILKIQVDGQETHTELA